MATTVLSESNREAIYISNESDWAETPSSPAMDTIRYSSEGLDYDKSVVMSDTIRSDYQEDGVFEVFAKAGGNIDVEYRYVEYDKLILPLFRQSSYTAANNSGTTIAAATTSTLTDSGNGFTTANGFKENQWVRISGFTSPATANNDIWLINSRADGTLGLEHADGSTTLTVKTAGDSVIVENAGTLRNGTTRSSILLEKAFLDVSQYIQFLGTRITGGGFSVNATEILKMNFNTVSKLAQIAGSSVSGSVSAVAGNRQMTASANVANLRIGGSPVDSTSVIIRGITGTIGGNATDRPWVTSKYSSDFGLPKWSLGGTISAYFIDETMINYLLNHTSLSIDWRMTDVDGNITIFSIPKFYITTNGIPQAGAPEETHVIEFPYMAQQNDDATAPWTMQIDKIAAA